jgi:hypothetical protein
MTLFAAEKAMSRDVKTEVARPVWFADEKTRWNGWVIFDAVDGGQREWFAVNEVTGEQVDMDVSSSFIMRTLDDIRFLRCMVDAGFPTRKEVDGSCGALKSNDLPALQAMIEKKGN